MERFKKGVRVYLQRSKSVGSIEQTEDVPCCRFCKPGEAIYVKTGDIPLLHVHKADIELWPN